jgi:hypothetical protein
MTKAWQIYYNAILGALGALVAWSLVGQVNTTSWNIHLANLFAGAGVGLFIGAALGVVEGLIVKRSLVRTLIGVVGGAVVGVISGMAGLLVGGVVFVLIGGGLVARVLGWISLGAFLGLGQGLVSLNGKRALYGLVGGIVAGLVGGLCYEVFTQLFLEQSSQVQVFLSAVGLVLIGVSLGIIIPLSVSIISSLRDERGLIVYLEGPRKGTEVEVVGSASMGSSDACEVYVQDKRMEKKQAEISRGVQAFEIRNIGALQSFYVDQTLLAPGQSMALQSGALIQMGEILMRFQTY